MIGVVPDGVVVFLPSYAFLDKVKAFWMKSGLLQRLGERKQVSQNSDPWGHVLIFGSCSTSLKRLVTLKLFFVIMHWLSHL